MNSIKKSPKRKKTTNSENKKMSIAKQNLIDNESSPFNKDYQLNETIKSIIIKEAFRMFDSDKSGYIDKKEFRKLVHSLGLELNIKKIDDLMRKIDKDGSGNIDIEEFTAMMMSYQFNNEESIWTHLSATFGLYDKDEDGIISEEDIIKVAKELEEEITPDEALILIDLSKTLNENKEKIEDQKKRKIGIDEEEFIELLKKTSFLNEKLKEEVYEEDKINSNNNSYKNQSSINVSNKNRNNSSKKSSDNNKSSKSSSRNYN